MQNPLENIHDARGDQETKHLSRPFKRFLFHYFFFVSKNDLNKRDLAQVLTIFSDYLPCNGGKVELIQKGLVHLHERETTFSCMSVTFAASNLRNSMPVDQYVVMKLGVFRINLRYFCSSQNFNEFLLFLFIYNFIHLSSQVSSDLLLVFLYMHNKASLFLYYSFYSCKGLLISI